MGSLFGSPKQPDTSKQEARLDEQERRADSQERRQQEELQSRASARRRRGRRSLSFNPEQEQASTLGRNPTK